MRIAALVMRLSLSALIVRVLVASFVLAVFADFGFQFAVFQQFCTTNKLRCL
jgi:hypothetical protein